MRQQLNIATQRGRAIAEAKRKAAERRRSERRYLHINRVYAELRCDRQYDGKQSDAEPQSIVVILNDISELGLCFFSSAPLFAGEFVSITLEQPMQFFVKGRVVWSEKHNTESHIISVQETPYRAGVEFIFQDDEERAAVRNFFDSLGPLTANKKK